MGHLKIHCDNCGMDWIVYHRDSKNKNARTCPMCGESINGQTWDRQILRAFGEMEDSNRELFKDHTGLHGTLFTVAYEPEVIYPNHDSQTESLREEIKDLKEQLDNANIALYKLAVVSLD